MGHIGNFPGNSFGAFSLLTSGPDGGLYTLGATPHAIWRTDVDAATSSPFVIFGEEVQQRAGGFVFAGGFIYVSAGDLLLRYDAQTGAFDGVVGSFPGAFTGSFSDNLLLGFDGRIYSQGPGGIWRINVHSGTAAEFINGVFGSGFVIVHP